MGNHDAFMEMLQSNPHMQESVFHAWADEPVLRLLQSRHEELLKLKPWHVLQRRRVMRSIHFLLSVLDASKRKRRLT